ncbi:RNA methyltransferase [Lautropia mirabilis]
MLVSPSLSANIGSAVRALTTMGIPDLMVAAPRDAAFREDVGALALAAGAEARLAQVGSRPSLDAALADCQLAVAVSAEGREFGPPPAFPGPLCAEVLDMLSAGQVQRVAFVFGTERTGLGTAEMARCQRWLTIPADADYSSLNLAQAVQIVAFSLRQAVLEREAARARTRGDATQVGALGGEPSRARRGGRRVCAAVEMREVRWLACTTTAVGASGPVKDWPIWGPWKGCIGMPRVAWRRWARWIRPGRGG